MNNSGQGSGVLNFIKRAAHRMIPSGRFSHMPTDEELLERRKLMTVQFNKRAARGNVLLSLGRQVTEEDLTEIHTGR